MIAAKIIKNDSRHLVRVENRGLPEMIFKKL